MPVSIEEVAEKAGVSPSTVSLALRNFPRVAPETRERVLRTVKELGYERNPPGRPRKEPGAPLSPKRTNRIALIVPDMTRSMLYAPVYVDLLHGVENAIQEHGKIMVLRHLDAKQSQSRPDKILPTRVDGALLFGGTVRPGILKALEDVPVVRLMRDIQPGEPWDRVTYDNRKLGVMAAEHLLGGGHKHTAFIGRVCGNTEVFLQQRGIDFKQAMQAGGGTAQLLIRDLMLITRRVHSVHPDVMLETLDTLLNLQPRPTAVFTDADIITQALYSAMQIRGVAPAADLTVVSCNNEEPILASLNPVPATLDIHAAEVGRRAVKQLIWRMKHPDAPPRAIILPPTLVAGDAMPAVSTA